MKLKQNFRLRKFVSRKLAVTISAMSVLGKHQQWAEFAAIAGGYIALQGAVDWRDMPAPQDGEDPLDTHGEHPADYEET